VLCVCKLAMQTLALMKGRHNKKTSGEELERATARSETTRGGYVVSYGTGQPNSEERSDLDT